MIETINSDYIHDGNASNFSAMVLDNSNIGPVLVNFWSRKAGPSLRQYPILDKMVHDYSGRMLLVNIDTDKEVTIATNYGIASVPTLKLVRFGEVVTTLHGFQSESDLKKIFDKYVTRDSDKDIEQAIHHYTNGEQDKAYQILSDAILEDQINPRLPLTICKLLKHEKRFDESLKLLDSLPVDLKADNEISELANELFFVAIIDTIDDLQALQQASAQDKENLLLIQRLSAFYVIDKQFELALQELEKIINLKYNFDNDYARIAMLKIFELIGEKDNLSQKYRPLLLKYTH